MPFINQEDFRPLFPNKSKKSSSIKSVAALLVVATILFAVVEPVPHPVDDLVADLSKFVNIEYFN